MEMGRLGLWRGWETGRGSTVVPVVPMKSSFLLFERVWLSIEPLMSLVLYSLIILFSLITSDNKAIHWVSQMYHLVTDRQIIGTLRTYIDLSFL